MQVIKRILEFSSHKESNWTIVPIGDIHFGHRNVDLDKLRNTIKFVEKTERCLWLGMGDYADAITVKDRRFDLNSVNPDYATPDKQYRFIRSIFAPIKEKCLGLLDGNHDYIHWKQHNHNYVDGLAYDLGVPYLGINAYVRLVFTRKSGKRKKQNRFDIYCHHGWTGARTVGGRINRITDLANIFPNLPLYLMGHVHLLGPAPPRIQLSVDSRLNVTELRQNFVFTGSYLKGYMPDATSYVEAKTYVPTTLGSPTITIKVNDNKRTPFNVTVGEVT